MSGSDPGEALFALGDALLRDPRADAAGEAARLGVPAEDARRCQRAVAALAAFSPETAPTPPPGPGDHVGPFRVEGVLGKGGMGLVLRARGVDGRAAALKLLLAGRTGPSARERFAREAEHLARLDHPGVVRFLGAGVHGDLPWLAVELIEGRDLERTLREDGPLSAFDARRLVAQVAEAVAHAHARGVVHRDLKAANVLVEASTGRVVVTDFGVARWLDAERLTLSGQLVGTPAAMSPEQAAGRTDVGPPADVWGLGVVLHQCLTGILPIQATSLAEILALLASDHPFPPPSRRRPGVPPDLDELCLACLERDPAARPSAAEVARAARAGTRRRRLPRRLAPLLLAALLLATGLVVAWRQRAPATGPGEPTGAADRAAWPLVWELGAGAPPELTPPGLWDGPSRPDPLLGARTGRVSLLAPVFRGQVEALGAGRVTVRYADPAGWTREDKLQGAARELPVARLRVEPQGDAVRLDAPGDLGYYRLIIGQARWEQGLLSLRASALPTAGGLGDTRHGVLRWQGPAGVVRELVLLGREGTIAVAADGHRRGATRRSLPAEPTLLAFWPGGPPGQRVRWNGAPLGELDGPATDGVGYAAPCLDLCEVSLLVDQVQVEGLPARADRPALAWAPPEAGARCSLELEFQWEGAGGGPCLALGAPWAPEPALLLELDPRGLSLQRGGELLARAELPALPRQGRLTLTREVDLIRARLETPQEAHQLEVIEPRPLRTPRAAYGASGSGVSVTGVTVRRGPPDGEKERTDELGLELLEEREVEPATSLRQGALRLSRLVAQEPGLAELDGERRREEARRAAEELERGAVSGEPAQREALARATWAWVIAGEPALAQSTAERLVELGGREAARERLDRLWRWDERPALMERLSHGWLHQDNLQDLHLRRVQEGAARVVLALCPDGDARATALARLAKLRPASDPQALELLREALGFAREDSVDGLRLSLATRLKLLGRPAEALAELERLSGLDDYYLVWIERQECLLQLGRTEEALEAAVCGLASTAGTRGGAFHATLEAALATWRPAPGRVHRALALTLLDRRGEALSLLYGLSPDLPARTQDLALYLRQRLEASRMAAAAAPPGPDARPTEVLALAGGGQAEAAGRLREVGERDPLVRALARLDEELAARVR